MFLKTITLENVRGISNLTLSFTQNETANLRHRTLLSGENGTGKSTVLKAIALVSAGSDAIGTLLNDPDDWITKGKNQCTISAILVNQKLDERPVSLFIRRHDTLRDIIVFNQNSLGEIDAALGHASRNYFVVGYGASRRLNQLTDFSMSERKYKNDRAQNVASLFNADAVLYPLTTWAMELDYQQSDGIALIKDTLNDLLPSVRFDSIDKKNKWLLFKVGNQRIPLHQLSDGYQNVAGWVGDMLYRITNTFVDFKSPLEARGLLLIDEIDLHLHPKWQRLVLDYVSFKFPKLQIVTTTHSPLTAQQAAAGELYFLQRDDNAQVSLEAFRGNPKQMLVHQLLLSPLFGLQTDESAEVEQEKEEYATLKMRKSLSNIDKQRIQELTNKLSSLPPVQRSNFIIGSDQIALLNQIHKELNNRNKE